MNEKRIKKIHEQNGSQILPVKPGMVLEIHEKVIDGNNTRIWKFKGTVLTVKKENQPDGTFLIRGTAARATVEKIYPLSFDKFEKVILLDEANVRRSKLYFLRDKVGKKAKLKSSITTERRNLDLLAEMKKNQKTVEKTDENNNDADTNQDA